VYQDLMITNIPSALEYIYYPRTSPAYYFTTCSVLGYSTTTPMYYAMTASPTSVATPESTGSQTDAGTSNDDSSDVSGGSSSGAQTSETTHVLTEFSFLSPALCTIIASVTLVAVL
jgi:hypothetical protein